MCKSCTFSLEHDSLECTFCIGYVLPCLSFILYLTLSNKVKGVKPYRLLRCTRRLL